MATALPHPPLHLMERVGALQPGLDPVASYDQLGRAARAAIERALPPGTDLAGAKVLDFGCGSGRVMRHWLPEVHAGMDLWGTEIDRPSVEWIEDALCPPLHVLAQEEAPPLDLPGESFDLIYAMSVFSHLTDLWAPWLLELHRVLKPGGLLVATVLGSELFGPIASEPWVASRVGHLSLKAGTPWDAGGPVAFVSEWWLRAHWGRAFDVLSFDPVGWPEADLRGAQAVVALRRREVQLSREELEAPAPGEPRETEALRYGNEVLWRDAAATRRHFDAQARTLDAELEHARAQAAHWRSAAEEWERRHDDAVAAAAPREPTAVRIARRLSGR